MGAVLDSVLKSIAKPWGLCLILLFCKMGINSVPTSGLAVKMKLNRTRPDTQNVSTGTSVISTFFEESEGFVAKPGSPQLCHVGVDAVALGWELVLRVKVMISQSSIDFST